MIAFKTIDRLSYQKEVDDHIILHPLFYSAVRFAYKKLIEKFPDSDYFEEIETDKKYYSKNLNSDLSFLYDSNDWPTNHRVIRRKIEGMKNFQEIEMTPFLLEIMRVFPEFYSIHFYEANQDIYIEALNLEVPLGGELMKAEPGGYNFPNHKEETDNAYQRTNNLVSHTLMIDYTFIYLALGDLFDSDISGKELSSVEDYFETLQRITVDYVERLKNIQMSKNYLNGVFAKLTNEARTSLSDRLTGRTFSFDYYNNGLKNLMNAQKQKFYYSQFGVPSISMSRTTSRKHPVRRTSPFNEERDNWNPEREGYITVEDYINDTYDILHIRHQETDSLYELAAMKMDGLIYRHRVNVISEIAQATKEMIINLKIEELTV